MGPEPIVGAPELPASKLNVNQIFDFPELLQGILDS